MDTLMRTVSLSNSVSFLYVMFFQGVKYSGSPQRSFLTLRRSRMFGFLAIRIYKIFFNKKCFSTDYSVSGFQKEGTHKTPYALTCINNTQPHSAKHPFTHSFSRTDKNMIKNKIKKKICKLPIIRVVA